MRIQLPRVRLAISVDVSGLSVMAPPQVSEGFFHVCALAWPLRPAWSPGVHAVEAGEDGISVFFSETVRVKARYRYTSLHGARRT